jgi:hypothetical protein
MVLRAEVTVSSRGQHFLHGQRVPPAVAREGTTSTVSFKLGVWAQRATLRGRAGEPLERAGVPSTLHGRASTLAGRLAAAAALIEQVEGSASGEHDHIFGFFRKLFVLFLLLYDLHQQ